MESKREFLLGLSAAKLAKLEKALEINWIVQLALAAVGVALVFDIGDIPRALARYLSQEQYNLKPVAVIILALLLYFFMKFGHLLKMFLEARELHDHLMLGYVGSEIDGKSLAPLRETISFFEGYYSPQLFGGRGPLIFVYYIVSPLVISLSQAAALFLIIRAYGLNAVSSISITVSGIALLLLYWEFWKAKRNHPQTTRMVVSCIVLVFVWLVLFAVLTAKP
jgi:hypothetical protein